MSKNTLVRAFVSIFHHFSPKKSSWEYEKCLQKLFPTYFSTFQNLRLGAIKLRGRHFNFMISPNEDFGRLNNALRVRF